MLFHLLLIPALFSSLCATDFFAANKKSMIPKSEKPQMSWGCNVSESAVASINSAFLNKNLPDKTEYLRTTIDLSGNYSYGEETFGHKAVDFQATFRHKAYWGVDGVKTDSESSLVGNSLVGSHSHPVSKPALWLYSAWLDVSLDALAGKQKGKGLNKFKVGYFPFELGRGIALGSAYGISQDFLGIYLKANDFFVPGVLLHGTLPNEIVHYSFYYARPDSESASNKNTMALSKGHYVNKKGLPFSGTLQDDGILACQLKLAPKFDDKKNSFELKPYGLFFWGMNKKVTVKPDSDVKMFTAGLASEAKTRHFEFGFDVAANFGRQNVESIDQNAIKLSVSDSGNLEETYSHILTNNAAAAATKNLKAELDSNLHRDGKDFTLTNGTTYSSDKNRVLPGYQNVYKGTMAVMDFSLISDFGISLSFAGGYASGGGNPHHERIDKNHSGFVGVSETYSGTRVPSMIMLGGGNVKRPLAVAANTGKLKDFITGAFTDIAFLGSGIKIAPACLKDRKIEFTTNGLAFFKDHQTKKYDLASEAPSTTELASRYLGAEINGSAKIEPLSGLIFSAKAAVFFPGCYYKDITGAKLSEDIASKLRERDLDKVDLKKATDYRIGSDPCYYVAFDLKYKF